MADPVLVDLTESFNETNDNSPDIAYPAHNAGDLLVINFACDGARTLSLDQTGPNGETLTLVGQNQNSCGGALLYWVATGSASSGTVGVTLSGLDQWAAVCGRVPAGDFNAASPISVFNVATQTTDSPTSAALTAPSDAGGQVALLVANDFGAAGTAASGWTKEYEYDSLTTGNLLFTRDAATSSSESVGSATFTISPSRPLVAITYIISPASASGSRRREWFKSHKRQAVSNFF